MLEPTLSNPKKAERKSTQNKGITPDVYLPSQIETEEFGEGKLSGSLEYDVISKARVKNFKRLDLSKDFLASRHEARAKKSILFSHYKTLKDWRKEQKKDKFLELNIDNRKAKKEKAEVELLALQNDTRKKLGLSTFNSYQAFLERQENIEEPDMNEEILFEAANILSDFIQESYKPVISMNKAG